MYCNCIDAPGINVRDFIILDTFAGIKIRRFVNWSLYFYIKYMVRLYKSSRIDADRVICEHCYTANICTITVFAIFSTHLRNEFYFFRSSLRYDRSGSRAK